MSKECFLRFLEDWRLEQERVNTERHQNKKENLAEKTELEKKKKRMN